MHNISMNVPPSEAQPVKIRINMPGSPDGSIVLDPADPGDRLKHNNTTCRFASLWPVAVPADQSAATKRRAV